MVRHLKYRIIERQELADGFALRFPPDIAMVLLLAEFITLERLCCPFLTLALAAQGEAGPLWLRLEGPEGVKPFLRAELGDLIA